ncbi:MAG: hypothetical protein HYR84_11940 [Planctomycetes bacterium]|nr:hypothetical protein [Planctomycetota bacterium]
MLRTLCLYAAICGGAVVLADLASGSPPIGPKSGTTAKGASTTPKSAGPTAKSVGPAVKPAPLPSPAKKVDVFVEKKVTPKIDPIVVAPKTTVSAGLKLPAGAKVDPASFAKIKPAVDLTKISGEKLVKMKPPADFKVKPIALAKIHVPSDAFKTTKVSAKLNFGGANFVLNSGFYSGNDYHLRFGRQGAWGWHYSGHHHHHWHHCIWDPSFGCYYYYDPGLCCYYYYNDFDDCYYPCWWFVDYCDTFYPWWMTGGFERWGYHGHHHGFRVVVGW